MNYTPQDIQAGQQKTTELQESPADFRGSEGLEKNNARPAGVTGLRAMAVMADPNVQAQTQQWMNLFSQSNQGFAWDQAKINRAQLGMGQAS